MKNIRELVGQLKGKQSTKVTYSYILGELEKYRQQLPEIVDLKAKTGHTHYLQKEVTEKLLSFIEEDENLVTYQTGEFNFNLGMECISLGLYEVATKCLENETAATQKTTWGANMGILSASSACISVGFRDFMTAYGEDRNKFLIKALDNRRASAQQDSNGKTIGIHCALSKLSEPTLKALDNHDACLLKDDTCRNIGYYIAKNQMREETYKAMGNTFMLYQEDDYGICMKDLAYVQELYFDRFGQDLYSLDKSDVVNSIEKYEEEHASDFDFEM